MPAAVEKAFIVFHNHEKDGYGIVVLHPPLGVFSWLCDGVFREYFLGALRDFPQPIIIDMKHVLVMDNFGLLALDTIWHRHHIILINVCERVSRRIRKGGLQGYFVIFPAIISDTPQTTIPQQ